MLPTLSPEEEAVLVKRAREGDAQAKEALIESCLSCIAYWAHRYSDAYGWQSVRIEEEELIGIGNATLVEALEKALEGSSPIGYLKGAAKRAMSRHCYYHRSLISTPSWGTYADLPVVSLDISVDADEVTLAESLVSPGEEPSSQRSFDALYHALMLLTERQRDVLSRLYGLGEYAQESSSELVCKDQISNSALGTIRKRAVTRLCALLSAPETSLEVYTWEQASCRLGLSKRGFSSYVSRNGVKAVLPNTGLYAKADIERLAQERAAKQRGVVCDAVGCEHPATSFDSEAVEFRCDEHVEVQA